MMAKKYRALTNLALRKSANKSSPLYEQWFDWPEGAVFEAPPHLNVKLAVEKGKIEEMNVKLAVEKGKIEEMKDG